MPTKDNHVKEPLFHIIKRPAISRLHSAIIRMIAVALALVVCGIVIVLFTGENPITMYATMIDGAIGTSRRA